MGETLRLRDRDAVVGAAKLKLEAPVGSNVRGRSRGRERVRLQVHDTSDEKICMTTIVL
jgi:hypothetical protein